MNATAKPRLLVLDGMRGVAAVLVVTFHGAAALGRSTVFDRGYLAVDFFFLLSGFVLAQAFEERMVAGRLPATVFLRARLRRLWPVAALGSVVGALILLGKGASLGQTIGLLATTLLLLPHIGTHSAVFTLNGPLWSLLFELVANLAHAAVLARMGERGLTVLVCVMAVVLGAEVLHVGSADLGHADGTFWYGFARVGFAYTCGVLLARRMTDLGACGWMWPLSLVALPLTITGVSLLPHYRAGGDLIMIVIVFPLLLVLGAKARAPASWRGALSLLGAISFPLYAMHAPLLDALRRAARLLPHAAPGTLQAGFLVVTLLVAYLVSRTPLAGSVRPSALSKVPFSTLLWSLRAHAATRSRAHIRPKRAIALDDGFALGTPPCPTPSLRSPRPFPTCPPSPGSPRASPAPATRTGAVAT